MRRSDSIIKKGVKDLGNRFKSAVDDIVGLAPASTVLDAGAANRLSVLANARASDLAVDFGVVFTSTVQQQQQLVDDLYKAYSLRFTPNAIPPVIGTDPELLAISSRLSQDLIGSVTQRIGSEAGRTFKLTSLSPEARGLTASNAVNASLTPSKVWSAQAARILRTESLRLASLSANQSYEALRLTEGRVDKMWIWSEIERPEHAAITGQIRRHNGFFDVPLRGGGIVKMRFPRDVMALAHPSATINCRCFVIPWPIGIPAPDLG